MDADQHRMFTLNMCSPGLRTHLRYRKTIDAELSVLRIDIADYFHKTLAQSKGGRLATLEGEPGAPSLEADEDEGWEAVELDPAVTEAILSQPGGQAFLVIVKKQALTDRKGGKGKGKGKCGKPNAGPRTTLRPRALCAPLASRPAGLSALTSQTTRCAEAKEMARRAARKATRARAKELGQRPRQAMESGQRLVTTVARGSP